MLYENLTDYARFLCFKVRTTVVSNMLASNKRYSGIAASSCVKTSGGVKMAATINIPTIIYFLFALTCSIVTNPAFVIKVIINGNSNNTPKSIMTTKQKFIYLLTDIIGTR